MSEATAGRGGPQRASGTHRALRRTLAHGVRLARVDVTRTARKHAQRVPQMLLLAVLAGGFTLGGAYGAYRLGEAIAAGDLDLGSVAVVEGARGVVALFWFVATVMYVVRSLGQRGTLANAEGVLTTVVTRDAVLGVMLSEYLYGLVWTVVPALAVGIGFAVGTGSVASVVAFPAGAAVVALLAVGVGYPLGLGVRHFVTRFAFVARHKNALIVLLFVGYFVWLSTGGVDQLMLALFEPMQSSPPGWAADLLLAGTPVAAVSLVRAAGSVLLAVGVAAAGVAVATRFAAWHWFSDPVLAGEQEEPASEPAGRSRHDRVQQALAGAVGRGTAALVVLAWRRALRAPMKLLYAAYPVFLLMGFAPSIWQTGTVPTELALFVVLLVAWGAGVAFALNPLGDQGSVLPATLLSPVTGGEFVRASALASLLVAVPVGVVATAAAAALSPLGLERSVLLVAASPVVVTLGTLVAVGIGMAFPRFTAVDVTRSTEAVVPSKLAFLLFTAYLVATAGAGAVAADELVRTVVAALGSALLPFGIDVSPGGLYWVALAVLVPLVLAPAAAYRYATRRFEGYTIE